MRVSTEHLLAEFLQEVRDIAVAQKRREEKLRGQRDSQALNATRKDTAEDSLPDITVVQAGRQAFIQGDDASALDSDGDSDPGEEVQDRDTGGTPLRWPDRMTGLTVKACYSLDAGAGRFGQPRRYCGNHDSTTRSIS